MSEFSAEIIYSTDRRKRRNLLLIYNGSMFRGTVNLKSARTMVAILCVLTFGWILLRGDVINPMNPPIGPIRQSVLILLVVITCAALDFARTGDSRRKRLAWLLVLAGSLIHALTIIIVGSSPDTSVAKGILRWNFMAWIILITGAFLRAGSFYRLEKLRFGDIIQQDQLILLGFVLLIFVLPVLKSGFYWDDAYFSSQIPAMKFDGISVWKRTLDEMLLYAGRGRINPFATFQFLTFYFLQSETAYKTFLVLLSAFDCVLFYQFIGRFWRRSLPGAVMLLMMPLCVQFRIYHDPMTGYYGLMQMMFAELMISLIWLLKYLDSGRKRCLAGSLVFFLIGLMSYELFYPMILLFLLIIFERRKSLAATIRSSVPYLLAEGLLMGLTFVLRRQYAQTGTIYQGTVFAMNPGKILATWFNQISAAFPFTYRLADNDATIHHRLIQAKEIFALPPLQFLQGIRWEDLLAVILALVLLISWRKRMQAEDQPRKIHWLFGVILLAASGLVIALSEKYQFQIAFGIGYIPIWFGYFGAAYLLGCAFCWLAAKMNQRVGMALLLAIFTVTFLFNQQTNRRVVSLLNEILLYPRETGEAALKAGILAQTGDEQSLVITNNENALWEGSWGGEEDKGVFFSLYSDRKVNTLTNAELASLVNADGQISFDEIPQSFTVIAYDADSQRGLAKAANPVFAEGVSPRGTLLNAVVKNGYVFVSGSVSPDTALTWTRWDGSGQTLALKDAWLIERTGKGSLYKLDDPHALYFDSIGLTDFR